MGLLPFWPAGLSSAGTAASFSQLSLRVPLLIFSGNTVLSTERSWHYEGRGEEGREQGGTSHAGGERGWLGVQGRGPRERATSWVQAVQCSFFWQEVGRRARSRGHTG